MSFSELLRKRTHVKRQAAEDIKNEVVDTPSPKPKAPAAKPTVEKKAPAAKLQTKISNKNEVKEKSVAK